MDTTQATLATNGPETKPSCLPTPWHFTKPSHAAGRGRGRLALAGRGATGLDLNMPPSEHDGDGIELEDDMGDGAEAEHEHAETANDAGHGESAQAPNAGKSLIPYTALFCLYAFEHAIFQISIS